MTQNQPNQIRNKNQKFFLKEYLYAYNFRNYMNSGIKLSECQLQRKFVEIFIRYLSIKKNKTINYITFMKISNDLDYMILMDNEKNIYMMDNNEIIPEEKKKNNRSQQRCLYCNGDLIDDDYDSSLIQVKDCKTFVLLRSNNTTPNSLVNILVNTSILIVSIAIAAIYITSPKQELIIYTGVLKSVFNSFFIKEIIL